MRWLATLSVWWVPETTLRARDSIEGLTGLSQAVGLQVPFITVKGCRLKPAEENGVPEGPSPAVLSWCSCVDGI